MLYWALFFSSWRFLPVHLASSAWRPALQKSPKSCSSFFSCCFW